jgi:hypothetical protein
MPNPTSLQTKFLLELFKALPEDIIVRGFAEGFVVSSADGSREVVILSDIFDLPAKITFPKSAYPIGS